jgi:citrate/tricarballylate utilization protein
MSGTDTLATAPHATPALAEADRQMVICNSCRYCEGLCAVFPAMEMRRSFADSDLSYLANLCHDCGACYDACQFAPPHEFNVNLPRALAIVRNDSYGANAWPRALGALFVQNGRAIAVITAASIALFVLGCASLADPVAFWTTGRGTGAFYRVIPHAAMVVIFGTAFLYAVAALALAGATFRRAIGTPPSIGSQSSSLWQASKDAGQLRYLDGGSGGCAGKDEQSSDRRKLFHHLTFYGFLLCFAATVVATFDHYALGRVAPYAWFELPVLLGSAGGIGLLLGPAGLLLAKMRRPSALQDEGRRGMDIAFLALLFLVSLSGFALLILRHTPAMGMLLALHLGVVFAFFATLPYGKFVHGIYRFLALWRFAQERRAHGAGRQGVA